MFFIAFGRAYFVIASESTRSVLSRPPSIFFDSCQVADRLQIPTHYRVARSIPPPPFFPPRSSLEPEPAVLSTQVIKVDRDQKLVAIKLTTLPPGVEPTPKVVAPPPAAVAEEAAPPATEA